jgi:hypothetical protein
MKNKSTYVKYREQVDKYTTQGEKEFEEGDLPQASEKFWGAATQILKAYCELKGWPHNGHALLFKDIDKISSDLKDKTLINGFGFASMLHINFYEGWLTKKEVEIYMEQTKEFISKMKELIEKEDGGR